MDSAKAKAAGQLKSRFPFLSLSDAYSALERNGFDMEAAVREVTASFAPSAGDHGVMYEMPPSSATGGSEGFKSALEALFQQKQGGTAEDNNSTHAFFGSGRRLGHTTNESPAIAALVKQQRSVRVTVYANEIRVDGGSDAPVKSIPTHTPEAKSFMDALRAGVVPPSLDALYPNCELNVELQDCMNREYHAPAAPFAAFQDEGRRLGANSGAAATAAAAAGVSPASAAELCYDPARLFHLDESQEGTVVRLVNTKGGQTELKMNPRVHTVEDLYLLAHQVEPDRPRFLLEVRDMPPRKLGPETRSQTIEAAKLKRAVVVMRSL